MPIGKYFMSVGGVLLALLYLADWYFPKSQGMFASRPQIIDTASIRIRSERKWPEKVVIDTSLPTIVPPSGHMTPVAQSICEGRCLDVFAGLSAKRTGGAGSAVE